MAFKILAQNALDAFSERKTADEFIALVERMRPDVVFFAEAYDADRTELIDDVEKKFTGLGYRVLRGPYEDGDGRKDHQGMMLLVRTGALDGRKAPRLIRVGTRNIVECWLADPKSKLPVHFVGAHLNDRSEAMRQAELDDLLGEFVVPGQPTSLRVI
jgi:hypothetical protein